MNTLRTRALSIMTESGEREIVLDLFKLCDLLLVSDRGE
jgi:hypothetical protein